jgi:hypothetical protein
MGIQLIDRFHFRYHSKPSCSMMPGRMRIRGFAVIGLEAASQIFFASPAV